VVAVDTQRSAQEDGPFLHPEGSHAIRPVRIQVDAPAVITDDERDLVVGVGLENDANRVRATVPTHISERLFDDPIQVEGGRGA
jgi:hypothetical protein